MKSKGVQIAFIQILVILVRFPAISEFDTFKQTNSYTIELGKNIFYVSIIIEFMIRFLEKKCLYYTINI